MRIGASSIEKLHAECAAVPPLEGRPSLFQVVKQLVPGLARLRERGYRWVDVALWLEEREIRLRPETLRRYYHRALRSNVGSKKKVVQKTRAYVARRSNSAREVRAEATRTAPNAAITDGSRSKMVAVPEEDLPRTAAVSGSQHTAPTWSGALSPASGHFTIRPDREDL